MIHPISFDQLPIPPDCLFVLPTPAGDCLFARVAYPLPAGSVTVLVIGFECTRCNRIIHADTRQELHHVCDTRGRWVMPRGNA
jgi:hypothetical protein